jgi:hypothetical protein
MRQRSGDRMKRPDGASSRRRSRNASGPQNTSRITPGIVRVEIDRQGLELLRNQSKSRVRRLFAGVSAGSVAPTLTSREPTQIILSVEVPGVDSLR